MKKICLFFSLLLCAGLVQATSLPDNMYMKAMRDEIKRSMKKLRRPGVEKPYFIAYKLEHLHNMPSIEASLGALYPVSPDRDGQLHMYVWVNIGNAQHDSLGYTHDKYYAKNAYRPRLATDVPKSYRGIRQMLWRLTDMAYTFAAETYQQKQAYERTKQTQTTDKLPDVIPAKQATYKEEILPPKTYDKTKLQTWVKEQSALGKSLPFVEQFTVSVKPIQKDTYYLNSRGGFYQTSLSMVKVSMFASMRDKAGFKRKFEQTLWLEDFLSGNQAYAEKEIQSFLNELEGYYLAVMGEAYVGPVLITANATGYFIYDQLVENFQNLKPLASANADKDNTSGKFSVEGKRIMAPGITVWDDPRLRMMENVSFGKKEDLQKHTRNIPLTGYMPVDDEGVEAQKLLLVDNGHIVDIPRTTRPLSDKKGSNGHARLTLNSMPRERLTNVVVVAEKPLTWQQMIDKLLERCKELGLEYGYIMYAWPHDSNENRPVLLRVYLNGDTEYVYGLQIDGITTRSLRDIQAAGKEHWVTHIENPDDVDAISIQTVDAPDLLLEELELITTDAKPDKKPFVPKP